MGSDTPPEMLLKACIETAKKFAPKIQLLFIGTKNLEALAKKEKAHFKKAKNVITMDDNPLFALRRKKDSSIAIGMKLLKEKKVDAFVSAGNTGALVCSAKMTLPMLPGISRPGLLALFPGKNKSIAVMDIGANVSAKVKNLSDYALLATSFKKIQGVSNPSVALLNIGTEEKKGTALMKKAYCELKKNAQTTKAFNFIGNIEGKEVFDSNDLDVLITDGFTGNIFLKTAEGMANFILMKSKKIPKTYFDDLKKYLNYEQYPGAILCGMDGLVVKCHGYASDVTFAKGVINAAKFAEQDLINSIKENISNIGISK